MFTGCDGKRGLAQALTREDMKDQYFGDIDDYRKYGLLRALARSCGLPVGVCWLLTKNEGEGGGEFRQYLRKPTRWRKYDPELYDKLQCLLRPQTRRTVRNAREWDLIPGAIYFDAVLADGRRDGYFEAAWTALRACELMFLDPDIGIEVPSTARERTGSAKYIYWSELKTAYRNGHSLLIYQHFPRVVREPFTMFLCDRLGDELGAPRVTAFLTARAAFLLAPQPRHAKAFLCSVGVESQWRGQIEPWPRESREGR